MSLRRQLFGAVVLVVLLAASITLVVGAPAHPPRVRPRGAPGRVPAGRPDRRARARRAAAARPSRLAADVPRAPGRAAVVASADAPRATSTRATAAPARGPGRPTARSRPTAGTGSSPRRPVAREGARAPAPARRRRGRLAAVHRGPLDRRRPWAPCSRPPLSLLLARRIARPLAPRRRRPRGGWRPARSPTPIPSRGRRRARVARALVQRDGGRGSSTRAMPSARSCSRSATS